MREAVANIRHGDAVLVQFGLAFMEVSGEDLLALVKVVHVDAAVIWALDGLVHKE
jgi:hypothetical protein